jgi:hypothetical protein
MRGVDRTSPRGHERAIEQVWNNDRVAIVGSFDTGASGGKSVSETVLSTHAEAFDE